MLLFTLRLAIFAFALTTGLAAICLPLGGDSAWMEMELNDQGRTDRERAAIQGPARQVETEVILTKSGVQSEPTVNTDLYDREGNLVERHVSIGPTGPTALCARYAYKYSNGRILEKTQTVLVPSRPHEGEHTIAWTVTLRYVYDMDGRRTSEDATYSVSAGADTLKIEGVPKDPIGHATHEYDAEGRLIVTRSSTTSSTNQKTEDIRTFSYDLLGRLAQIKISGATHEEMTVTRGYDINARLYTEKSAVGATQMCSRTLGYDLQGRLVQEILREPPDSVTDTTIKYEGGDVKFNWVKRTVSSARRGTDQKDITAESRKIAYYE